ncbi:hypothetical protein JI435_306690, partial [Parastagonospora nodorum SN15]
TSPLQTETDNIFGFAFVFHRSFPMLERTLHSSKYPGLPVGYQTAITLFSHIYPALFIAITRWCSFRADLFSIILLSDERGHCWTARTFSIILARCWLHIPRWIAVLEHKRAQR